VVADSRRKNQNMDTSHSIFTKIFSNSGNAYPNLLEMPTFCHANNHALIQIADFICSGLLFPMAAYSFCTGYVHNVHVSPQFQ